MNFIFKILKNIPDLILNFLFIPIWHFCGFFKRDRNLWIFVSWFGQKYSDSSRILFEYAQRNCPNIRAVWISRDKKIVQHLRQNGFESYSAKSARALFLSSRASKLFSTTGYEMFYGFTKGIAFYELWHGMPLKKILNDDEFSGGTMRKNILSKILYKINQKFFVWKTITTLPNVYTFSNARFFNQFLQTAFSLPEGKILNFGLPRNDALFYKREEKLIKEIKEKYPNCKILLYMPTFRTSAWTKKVFDPFSNDFLFDEEKLHETLVRKNVVFVYKPHFYDLQFVNRKNASDRFFMIKEDDFGELYNFAGQADILMTDYSSIYFDFILTRKPVILAPFDFEEYVTTCRSHYFDYSELEGVRAENWNEVLKIIENESYKKVPEEKIKQFAEFCDGNSCRKIVERME